MAPTHRLCLLNGHQHSLLLLIFFLILLKLLLALGEEHSPKGRDLCLAIMGPLHLDRGQNLAQVSVRNAEVRFLQCLPKKREI